MNDSGFPASHQLQHPNHLDQHRTDVELKIRNFGWQSVPDRFYHLFKRFWVDLRKRRGDKNHVTTLKFLSIQVYVFHSVSRSALWLAAEVLEPVSSIAAAIGNRRASPTTLPLARPAQTCLPIINHATKEKSGDNNESTFENATSAITTGIKQLSHLLYAISTLSSPAHASAFLQSFSLRHIQHHPITPTGLVYTNDAKDSIDAVKSKKNQFCRDSFYNEEDPKDCWNQNQVIFQACKIRVFKGQQFLAQLCGLRMFDGV